MIILAKGLKIATGLLNLYLDSNNIEVEGAKALSESLEKMENLKKICLENNKINDEGIDYVCRSLRKNT